jgi:hypothetical protein
MKKSRFTEEQIIGILKRHEAGLKTADSCREQDDWRQDYNCGRPYSTLR